LGAGPNFIHMNVAQGLAAGSYRGLAALWIAVAAASVGAVVVAPLAAFVLMISAFGLPHVLYELRYVDERFSPRLPLQLVGAIGGLVALIALVRTANSLHVLPSATLMPIEFALGAALAFLAALFMRENRLLGAVVGAVFAAGALWAPIETFLIWAWLHNLTPLGFVAEITEGEERQRWLVALGVPFLVLPLLVATGVFHEAAALAFPVAATQGLSAFGAGEGPLASFLPPSSHDLHLFSAAVVAQAMHYVAVIVLLPRLLREKQGVGARETIVPWPDWRWFGIWVTAIAAVAFAIYAVSYADARAGYSVAAAIHAWIELPILLLALGQGFRSAPHVSA
jgi:hypothetical protein